jgi:hypothetical protein
MGSWSNQFENIIPADEEFKNLIRPGGAAFEACMNAGES